MCLHYSCEIYSSYNLGRSSLGDRLVQIFQKKAAQLLKFIFCLIAIPKKHRNLLSSSQFTKITNARLCKKNRMPLEQEKTEPSQLKINVWK